MSIQYDKLNSIVAVQEQVEEAAVEETAEVVAAEKKNNKKPESKNNKVKIIVSGYVNAELLNVRYKPEVVTGNVVGQLTKSQKVSIFMNKSTNDFYYVVSENENVRGYAMKKYIKLAGK